MKSRPSASIPRFLLLALLPSGLSGVACLFVAVFIVVLHVLFLSLNFGTILPTLFDGQWAVSYTNVVVQPLQEVVQNNLFNQVLTILMWSVVGLIVYEAGEYLLRNYRGLREAKRDVQMVGGALVRHPLLRSVVLRFVWRTGLGVSFIVALLLLNPLLKHLFDTDYYLFDGMTPLPTALRSLLINLLIWAAVAHGFVAFARLYSLRARLRR